MGQVKKETIVRTIVLAVALINQVLTLFGYSLIPISDVQINEFISLGFTIFASLWTWWQNNSFTENAILADEMLEKLNAADKEAE